MDGAGGEFLCRVEGGRSQGLRIIMKKKQLWLVLVLVPVLVLLCAGSAFAAAGSLDFKMELSKQEFFEPTTIDISFTVKNTSNSEMPGPVMLYYPDGSQIEEFGAPVLGAGSSKNWSGTWSVTQEELDIGKISFKVVYPEVDENGEIKQIPVAISKHIQYKGAEPKIDVSRSIVPQIAEEGQDVSIVYEIKNTGSADITGLTIQEAVNNKEKASVGAIKSGETAKYTFTTKMKKKDLTSQATITYKAGGKTYKAEVEPAVIKFGKVNLTASLSADKKGGVKGDSVKLTLKLKNSGTTDFTDIVVMDEKLGTVFSGETVKAGETLTLEKEVTITETQELLFTVKGNNGAGGEIETATGKVKIVATDPDQQIVLDVEIEPDREAVYQIPGGIVRFTGTVTNRSKVDVENVSVKAVDKTLYTFEKIPAGESRSFTRDTEISMPGIFRFTASVKDPLGETMTFESNTVSIQLTDPPADPTPTPVVLPARPAEITVPPATEGPDRARDEENLRNIDSFAETAKWILAGIAGVLLTLLLIGAVRRIAQKSESAKAIDHLEGGSYRDYSALPKGRKRNEVVSGEENRNAAAAPEQSPPENIPQSVPQGGELMAETLQRLQAKRTQESAAQAPEAAPADETPETVQEIQSASEAAHRRRARKE